MNLDEGVTVASMAKVREDKSIIENQNEEESAEEEYSEENKEVSRKFQRKSNIKKFLLEKRELFEFKRNIFFYKNL